MSDLAENRLKTIKSWDEVPEFKSEREEHEFWGSHSPVSVRMENELVNCLKVLAAIKGVGYQTLLRQFVADRVYEEEKRGGIIG